MYLGPVQPDAGNAHGAVIINAHVGPRMNHASIAYGYPEVIRSPWRILEHAPLGASNATQHSLSGVMLFDLPPTLRAELGCGRYLAAGGHRTHLELGATLRAKLGIASNGAHEVGACGPDRLLPVLLPSFLSSSAIAACAHASSTLRLA